MESPSNLLIVTTWKLARPELLPEQRERLPAAGPESVRAELEPPEQ